MRGEKEVLRKVSLRKTKPDLSLAEQVDISYVSKRGWAQPQVNLMGSTWRSKDTHVVLHLFQLDPRAGAFNRAKKPNTGSWALTSAS